MAPPPPGTAPGRSSHSRTTSLNAAAPAKPESKASKRASIPPQPEVHFTALIRLPFPRGEFVDPPQVDWDAAKDKALWKIIMRTPKASDLNFEELASKFQVPHAYIVQQVAWLYERHLSHLHSHMKKAAGAGAGNLPAGTGSSSTAVGGYAMKRLGSGGGSRAPSSLSIRSKDSPRPESSIPGTPRAGGQHSLKHHHVLPLTADAAPPLSRSPSTNTVTQSRANVPPPSPRQQLHRSFRAPSAPVRKPSPAIIAGQPTNVQNRPSSPSSTSPTEDLGSSSSSSSSEEDQNPIRRSHIFKRPPRFNKHKSQLSRLDQSAREDADDGDVGESSDNDDSNTFLPFANRLSGRGHDQTSTIRQPHRDGLASPQPSETASFTSPPEAAGVASPSRFTFPSRTTSGQIPPTDSSASSASSAAPAGIFTNVRHHSNHSHRVGQPASTPRRNPGPLSPRHRAELARLNPHKQRSSVTSISSIGSTGTGGGGPSTPGGKGKEAERSDGGTPSMGSSFSDLDDASVTQSALEEALLSNMQHGRMSTLSSLRSRYL